MLEGPNNPISSIWKVYNPDDSVDEFFQRMKGKDDKPFGWLITAKYSRGGYDEVHYFYKTASGGEYLLQRIIHKKTITVVLYIAMTYIDYAMTSTTGHLYQKS